MFSSKILDNILDFLALIWYELYENIIIKKRWWQDQLIFMMVMYILKDASLYQDWCLEDVKAS